MDLDFYVFPGEGERAGAAFAASAGCKTMLDFLSSINGKVRQIILGDEYPGNFESCIQSDSLYFLAKGVRDQEEAREAGSFVRFLHALPTSCADLGLYDVKLISEEEISALCSAIGSPHCTLHTLWISNLHLRGGRWPDAAQTLVKDALFNNTSLPWISNLHLRGGRWPDAAQTLVKDALFNNTSLRSLNLFDIDDTLPLECFVPALSRTPFPIQHLYLSKSQRDSLAFDISICELFTGLASNTISLTKLEFCWYYFHDTTNQAVGCTMGTMLRTNKSLESFDLRHCVLPGEVIEMLFASLEHNTHLTSFSLFGSRGQDWPPSASFILDSLRVNGTLSSLDLSKTPLEGKSAAAIDVQLARNKQQVKNQVPALNVEGSTLVPSTTLRLFLCGLPFSGKTTLSRSLVRWNARTSNFGKCLSCAGMSVPNRTRGIEISSLEKDGVKVSLWDLAGQPEYYAFHDQMFPDLSNDATPSLFLFVWCPIQLDKGTGKEIRDKHGKTIVKTLDSFENEFRYWLRFIASKTLKSLKFKPKLSIAITRSDLVQHQSSNIKSLIYNTFHRCQNDFQNHIHLDIGGVFEMNARDPRGVNTLSQHIFQLATLLLKSRPLVHKVCNEARIKFAKSVQLKLLAPLVTRQDFIFECEKRLDLYDRKMQEAVAFSLNESGDLIYFKELDLVVIDTEWFCHDFMGNLLHFSSNTNQNRGFFSPQYLQGMLEQKVNSTPTRYRGIFSKATRPLKIKGEELVRLLIGLQLACKQDDGQENSDIFIPISLCTNPRRQVDLHIYLNGDEEKKTFIGRRLMCKDSVCTFFTQGIFTILQVSFHKLLGDRRVTVHLEEDVMAFAFGGVKVLMEFYRPEGKEHFIDILASSVKDSLDYTIEWLQENVILDVEKVCAKPRGIQGVELAHAVIQQASIQNFLEASRRPAVLIEELQDELKTHVEKKGVDDGMKNAMYTWQIDRFPSNCVAELLGQKETIKVIRTYLDALSTAHTEISSLFVEEAESSQPQKSLFGTSLSSKEREILYDKMCEVKKDVGDVKLSIEGLHNAVKDLRNTVLPKLGELFTFVKEGEAGKLPRMFVVTEDDGRVKRVVSAIVPGLQNVRLQLLCECRNAPCHFVDGKRGMSLAKLDEGLLKRGLPYINAILKVAYVVARVGAHVAVGYGDVIPDFTKVLANIADASVWDNKAPTFNITPDGSRVNLKEGQQWLFDVLSNRNCTKGDQIYEVFGLRRIRVFPSMAVAWVCDEHYGEGSPYPA